MSHERQELRECVSQILVYILTQPIHFSGNSIKDPVTSQGYKHKFGVLDIEEVYYDRFCRIFDHYHTTIMEEKESKWTPVLQKMMECIPILAAIPNENRNNIENMIRITLHDEKHNEIKANSPPDPILSDIGICCYCGDECNPLSQSCGACARGLSGRAFGFKVPEHLKKFT